MPRMTQQMPNADAPHDILAWQKEEAEYDAMLLAMAEMPRTQVVLDAVTAIRKARIANAARAKRVVHEHHDLRKDAFTKYLAVNAATAPAAQQVIATSVAVGAPSLAPLEAPTVAVPTGLTPLVPAEAPAAARPIATTATWRVVIEGARADVYRTPVGKAEVLVAREPVILTPAKPSLLSWAGSYLGAVKFIMRAQIGPSPLEMLTAYASPDAPAMPDAIDDEIRDSGLLPTEKPPTERDVVVAAVNLLARHGALETMGGLYWLSEDALKVIDAMRTAKLDTFKADLLKASQAQTDAELDGQA